MKKLIILSVFCKLIITNFSFSQTTYNIATENGNTINTCSGIFVDNGGAGGSSNNNATGNYGNSLNQSITFCPESPGDVIKVTFTLFNIKETSGQGRTCEDWLYVFQGNAVTATPDDVYCGDLTGALLPVVLSTSPDGCITFQFVSDNNGNRAGWVANISCVTPCQNPIANLLDLSDISICPSDSENPGSLTIGVDASNSTIGNYAVPNSQIIVNYDWEWGDGTFETTNTANTTHTYAEPGIYVVKLRVRDDNTDFSSQGCSSNNSITRVVRVLPSPSYTGSSNSPIDVNCGDNVTITTVATSQTSTQDLPTTAPGNITLPDGNGQSYVSGANFSGVFPDGATLNTGCYPTVNFNLEHSWSRDLTIDLIAPNGQSVRLFNRHGIPGNMQPSYKFGTCVNGADDGVPGCGANYTVVNSGGNSWINYGTAAAQAGTTATTACTGWPTGGGICETGTYYKAGTYNSSTSFATIDGAPLNGTWTLRITDNQSLDDGTLFSWELTFPNSCYAPLESVTPDISSVTWSHSGNGPAIPIENSSIVSVTDPGPDACPIPGTCIGTSITNTINLGTINSGAGQLNYEALIVDEFGCQYLNIVTLNVVCDLSVTVSGATTFCGSGSTTLTFSGTPNATVTYNINGGANQTIVLDAAGIASLNTGLLSSTTNYNLITVSDGITTTNLSEVETITIVANQNVDAPSDVSACDSYTLPVLSAGNYFTETNGGGTALFSGDVISSTQTIFVFAQTGTVPNCTDENSFTVTINNSPTFGLSKLDPSICNATDGGFTITGLNATTSYTITYNDDGVTVGPIVILSNGSGDIPFTNLNAGSYDNVIVSLNGCSTTNFSGVSLLNPGAPIIDDIPNQIVCLLDTFFLPAITGTLSGNEAYFDGPNGTGNQFNAGDSIISDITIYIYDANGACSAQESFTISFLAQPTVSLFTGGNTYCQGDVIANISATVTGTGPWTIDYTLDGVTQSVSNATSPINLGNNAGVYVLTNITDANCSNTANQTQTITINAQPTVSAFTGGNAYCPGEMITDLSVALTGTGPWILDYTLNGVNQTVNTVISPISLGNVVGNYVLTNLSDAICSSVLNETQTISLNTLPSVTNITGGAEYCAGETINEIVVNTTGTAPYTISYTLNGVAQNITNSNTSVPLGNSAGVYVLTSVADAFCSNSASGSQTIVINALPTVSAGNDVTVCENETITLSGSGATTYTWNNGITNGVAFQAVSSLTYTVTGTDANNCQNTDQVNVTVTPLPSVTLVSGGNTYCAGETASNITVTTTGTGPWTINYTLDGNAQTINGATSPISLGNSAGIYVVSSISSGTCSNTATGTQTINFNPIPSAPLVSADTAYCEKETKTAMSATASAGGTITWFSNSNLTNQLATGTNLSPETTVGTTSYYVVQTINSCTSPASVITIVINSCDLVIPTAFTPDQDGVNDTWKIENLNDFYPNCNVKIYNRWGNLVFESTGYKDEWKGDFKGENLPVGSYFYIIDFNDGKTEIENGTVSIIKNNK
jgi:gliding motility-associated-like protein